MLRTLEPLGVLRRDDNGDVGAGKEQGSFLVPDARVLLRARADSGSTEGECEIQKWAAWADVGSWRATASCRGGRADGCSRGRRPGQAWRGRGSPLRGDVKFSYPEGRSREASREWRLRELPVRPSGRRRRVLAGSVERRRTVARWAGVAAEAAAGKGSAEPGRVVGGGEGRFLELSVCDKRTSFFLSAERGSTVELEHLVGKKKWQNEQKCISNRVWQSKLTRLANL